MKVDPLVFCVLQHLFLISVQKLMIGYLFLGNGHLIY
eukprot:XP_001704728.1 Hypothetical protein GL50803_34466 [Giardia lamblia ATCC 50803]